MVAQINEGIMLTNEEYEKYKNMIHKKALCMFKTTGVPIEELISQGNLLFCEALLKYNADKASFSTYLTMFLECRLITFCKIWKLWSRVSSLPFKEFVEGKKKETHGEVPVFLDNDSEIMPESCEHLMPSVLYKIRYEEWRHSLSSNARQVVDLVTSFSSAEILGVTGATPSKHIRGAVKRYVMKELGWTYIETLHTIREIKQRLEDIK
jgi:hypothetical protein